MTTLDEFAVANDKTNRKRCKACHLPKDLLDVVEENEGRTKPHGRLMVSKWLAERGQDVSPRVLYYHATNHMESN